MSLPADVGDHTRVQHAAQSHPGSLVRAALFLSQHLGELARGIGLLRVVVAAEVLSLDKDLRGGEVSLQRRAAAGSHWGRLTGPSFP